MAPHLWDLELVDDPALPVVDGDGVDGNRCVGGGGRVTRAVDHS